MERPRELFVKASLEVLEKYGAECLLSRLVQRGRDNVDAFDEFCVQMIATLRPLEAQSRVKALSSFHQLCITVIPRLFVEPAIHKITSSTLASTYISRC